MFLICNGLLEGSTPSLVPVLRQRGGSLMRAVIATVLGLVVAVNVLGALTLLGAFAVDLSNTQEVVPLVGMTGIGLVVASGLWLLGVVAWLIGDTLLDKIEGPR